MNNKKYILTRLELLLLLRRYGEYIFENIDLGTKEDRQKLRIEAGAKTYNKFFQVADKESEMIVNQINKIEKSNGLIATKKFLEEDVFEAIELLMIGDVHKGKYQ